MKKFFLETVLCIVAITMVSCSELSLSETELEFPAAFFETGSFVVKTDLNWEIVERPDWVSIGKIEENGKTIVEVTPEINHSFDSPRKGKIKIQTAEKYYIVDIFQDCVHLKKESGDLGLSVEWNTCNLGATKSTDFGNYYTWDEIHSYQSNGWRLPTHEEQQELTDNCVLVWGKNNGVIGCYFVAKNGNYIFLSAGYRPGTGIYVGSYSKYWSSSADGGHDGYAYDLSFYGDRVYADFSGSRRGNGGVRLVKDVK